MRQIIPATLAHWDFISNLLVRDYQKLNSELWTDFYQANPEYLAMHVKERIEEDGAYKYFVLVDEYAGPLAYLSMLVMKNKGEILMLGTKEEVKSDEILGELLDFWVEYLKKQGVKYLLFEVASHEEDYRSYLQTIGAKALVTRFVLS